MLRSVREMTGYTVRATDGEMGRVTDFYFDDDHWTVRYLVVNTGDATAGSPTSRGAVLVSPMAVTNPDFDSKRFDLSLTREQVLNGPGTDSDQPVSREWEERYSAYYRLAPYWGGPLLWGGFATAVEAAAAPLAGFPLVPNNLPPPQGSPSGDNHLRSAHEVIGYAVQASDASGGSVEDLLVDDRSWKVHHIVVDTTSFWPGGEVLVPAELVTEVEWAGHQISFDLTREEIKRRADFRPSGMTGH